MELFTVKLEFKKSRRESEHKVNTIGSIHQGDRSSYFTLLLYYYHQKNNSLKYVIC